MKKDTLMNRNVVKAISIALAAVMTTTPMTALAEEANVPNDGNNNGEEQNIAKDTSVTATADAIDNAQNTISNKDNGNNVVLDDPMTLPSTEETLEVVPDAVEAAGSDVLAGVTTTVGEDADEINYADDVIGKAEESNTGLLGANAELEDAEDALSDVADAEAAAAASANKASAIIDEIDDNNQIVTEETEAAKAAAQAAAEALEEAQNAKTKADAQAAVDKAEEAVEDAEAAQAKAQEAYDANVEKLAAAEAELAEAAKALEAAKAAVGTTEAELKAAQDAVNAAAANAEALKVQVDKDADAFKKSEGYALKAAYDNMITQKSVISKLYESDGKDDWLDEFGDEGAGSGYWAAADKYFELYLKHVYGSSYVSGKWEKSNTLGNGWSYVAERDNVFTVTYKNGDQKKVTAYYNYHTADTDGNITIYEKQIATGEKMVITQQEVLDYETKLGTETEDGWVPYEASEDEISVDKNGAKYVATGEATVEEAEIELSDNKQLSSESVTKNDGTTVTTEVTENEVVVGDAFVVSTELDEDGNIVETMNVAVKTTTTTTVTEKKFYEEREKYCLSYADAEKKGKKRMKEIAKELMEEGITLTGNADNGYDGFFELDTDYYHAQFQYEIRYTVTKTEITTSEETNNVYSGANTYSTTKYENHDFVVGSHYEDKETQETYNYWEERKNTTNDAKIKAAIADVEQKLADLVAKQDAAAIALVAAKQAQADVEKAKVELGKLSVNDKAYNDALEAYNDAYADWEDADDKLTEINNAVVKAQQDYEDAAKELGRFVPTTSGGSEGGAGTTGGTTLPVVDAEPEAEEIEVLPLANAPVVAVAPVVEDEPEEEEENLVTIGEEDVPLASGSAEESDDQSLMEIGEEEVPLAAMPTEEEKAKMSWWWLLIVAVLGATGYKMYKDHQKKNEKVTK